MSIESPKLCPRFEEQGRRLTEMSVANTNEALATTGSIDSNDSIGSKCEDDPDLVCPVCLETICIASLSQSDTSEAHARGPLSDLNTNSSADLSDSIALLIRVCDAQGIRAPCIGIDTPCGHTYHASCLMDHIVRCDTNSCPVCRRGLVAHEKVRSMTRAPDVFDGTHDHQGSAWPGEPGVGDWHNRDDRSCVTISVIASMVTLIALVTGCS